MGLTVRLLPGEFAVCRLEPNAAIPSWVAGREFHSISRTADELSVICAARLVPAAIKQEIGWSLFQLVGPFPFTATGILSSVLSPLADARVSVLAVATFDTDYFLAKSSAFSSVVGALQRAGHRVLLTEV